MTANEPGTAPATPQAAPSGTAAPAQQPTTPTPATPQATPATQPAVKPPTVEELQTQLAEANKKLTQAETSAKHFQSQFDQMRARTQAAIQPAQTPTDPLAPFVKELTDQGYNEQDARVIVNLTNRMVAPLQQQLQTAQSTVQGFTQIDAVLEQAVTANPKLFADQRVIQHTRNELIAAARAGQVDYLTPEYAAVCGQMGWAQTFKPWDATPNQQVTTTVPPGVRPLSFQGPQPGFTPAAPTTKPENPLTAQYEKQMRDYTGIPAQQQQ